MIKKILVGDIGGTNTTLGIFNLKDETLSKIKEIKTKDLNIELELSNMLKEDEVEGISLAVAGHIQKGFVKMTNLPKNFSSKILSKKMNLDVLIINDFEALGFYAKSISKSARNLVLGAGTGLGKVLVYNNKDVISSEGSHQDFPFKIGEEKLKEFFYKKLKRNAEYDDLISGRGLSLIKEFHAKKKLSLNESNPQLMFLHKDEDINKKTIADFSKFYGRFIKNSAIDFLPDQILVTGGIARKNPWILKNDEFKEELNYRFIKKPKISLLKDKYASLKGAGFAFNQ